MAKVTLKKPGTVKLITNTSNVTQTILKNGETQTVSPKIVTRVFKNSACTEQLGKDVEAVRNKNSETSVMYLEKGTYYIQYDAPDVASDSAINGTLQVAVLYESYQTNETVAVSSKNKQNTLEWSKVQHGFLSQLSNTDYYKFKVESYISIKLWCRTSESGKTNIVLYNGNYEKVAKASGSGSMEEVGFEKYVKPGIYYVEISSTAKGSYDVNLTNINYHLALSYKIPFVSVKTVNNYEEIRYLKGNYYDADLNSKVWKKGIVLKKGKKTFAVRERGYYTVRVTDASGKRFMKTIYIAKVDKTKPSKPTFTSCKAGQYVIKGKAEKNSTVYVKINAYETVHKVKVSKDGTFRVSLDYYLFKGDRVKAYAVDQAGNKGAVRTIKVK